MSATVDMKCKASIRTDKNLGDGDEVGSLRIVSAIIVRGTLHLVLEEEEQSE
jgi:hypothetical protein